MKNFKYKTIFGSYPIKCLLDEDKDKFLSQASLENLRGLIPDIDVATNFDLLPISFTVAVVNLVNKNDDVINTQTALAIYKNFIRKYIDLEHKKKIIVGVILTSGFTEFGTEKPLTEEQVKNLDTPFNITLGGVIWKLPNPELVELIEESNNPSSEDYLSISSSWELAFEDYSIISLNKNQKNIAGAKIVSDSSEVENLSKNLKCNKGSGELNGQRLYRLINGSVCPIGIGLTEKPAANVKGIAVNINEIDTDIKNKSKDNDAKIIDVNNNINNPTDNNSENNKKNISQSTIPSVKIERTQIQVMFKSIKDITDENLKVAVASNESVATQITDLISQELKNGNEKWLKEKNELTENNQKIQAQLAKADEQVLKNQEDLKKVKEEVEALAKEKSEREAVEKFNIRMGQANDTYDFDDEQRSVIASELKDIKSDEEYTKWEAKAKKLFKPFQKKDKKSDKTDDTKDEQDKSDAKNDKSKKDDSKASSQASASSVVDDAIDNGKKDVGTTNTSSANTPSLIEKYKNAFSIENFIIKE